MTIKASYRRKIQDAHLRVVSDSLCTAKLFGTRESPTGLWIAFAGRAAALPSKANSYQIQWRYSQRGIRIPKIVRGPGERGVGDALTALLIKALKDIGAYGVRFSGSVCIDVYCGERVGRWDSHNSPKFVGDWLQRIGIIGDDSLAEILPYKKADYFEDKDILGTTEIIIQPRSKTLTDITRGYIEERRKVSTGYTNYIG